MNPSSRANGKIVSTTPIVMTDSVVNVNRAPGLLGEKGTLR